MSGFYLVGKQDLLERAIPSDAGVWAVGVNADYIFDTTHSDFAVFTPHILLPEAQLSGVTFDGGILRANEQTWIAAGAGVVDRSLQLKGIVIYFQLGDVGSLLAYIDSAQAGLPQLVTGVNVTAKWDTRGILKL
jgi:hypothetical protein